MLELLDRLALCIEKGKINSSSPFPPAMRGEAGAVELTKQVLDLGIPAEEILNAMMTGMKATGIKFREGKVYVPEVLMSARAMNTAMDLLKPYFRSGEIKYKGRIIIGTVAGDLHDIGKNIVKMIIEGNGWEVKDLGTDVSVQKFIDAVKEYTPSAAALSALLTTTMLNMEMIVKELKREFPELPVIIGGAPVTIEFSKRIGADFYSHDPHEVLDYLKKIV